MPGAAAVEYLICPHVCRSSSATGDFSSWGSIRLSVYPQIFGAGRPFLLVIQACSGDPSLQAFCSGNRTNSLEPILYLCQMLSQRILVVVIFPFIPPLIQSLWKITSSSSSSKLLCLQVSNVGLRPLVPSSPPRKTPSSARRRSRRTSSARRVGTPPSPQAPQPGTSHPPVIIFQWMECV